MDLTPRLKNKRVAFHAALYGLFLGSLFSAAAPCPADTSLTSNATSQTFAPAPVTKKKKVRRVSRDTRDEWSQKWGPLVPHKTFPKKCDLCHLPDRWDLLRGDFHFDHLKETGYALEGAHATASCLRCHNDRGPIAVYVKRGCSGCHVDPHRSKLGLQCQKCHDEVNWRPMPTVIMQHAQTRFPLVGIHVTVECQQCHTRSQAGDFSGAPTDCYSCHVANFNSAPNHVAMNFSQQCQRCHNTTTWAGATFDHSTLGANPNCYACHQTDYLGTTNPNHQSSGFPTTCGSCHNTSTWLGALFNHSSTGFPLTGKHATAQCADCHVGNNYNLPNANCVNCHQTDYNGALSPVNHAAAGPLFAASNCNNCHGDYISWQNGTFNHAVTGYALTGLHMVPPRTCTDCHVGNNYNLPNANCLPCHQTDYNGATSPINHATSQLTNCQDCHDPTATWASTPKWTHPTGSCGGGTGTSTPWTHQNVQSCTDCHTLTIFPSGASGWNCSLCHSGHHAGTPPNQCAGG